MAEAFRVERDTLEPVGDSAVVLVGVSAKVQGCRAGRAGDRGETRWFGW